MSKEKTLKADDFLKGLPPELAAMLKEIDIENEHEHHHDEDGHHVHGPGCNH